jgi:hypothetical protein
MLITFYQNSFLFHIKLLYLYYKLITMETNKQPGKGKSSRLSAKEQVAKMEFDRVSKLLSKQFATHAIIYSLIYN